MDDELRSLYQVGDVVYAVRDNYFGGPVPAGDYRVTAVNRSPRSITIEITDGKDTYVVNQDSVNIHLKERAGA